MSKTNFDRDLYLANKSEIASAFGALEQADNISENEKAIIRRCLSNYNSMLDAENKESEETEKHEELSSESNEEKKRIETRRILNELTIKSFFQAVQRYCEELSRKPGTENLSKEEIIRDYYKYLKLIEMIEMK